MTTTNNDYPDAPMVTDEELAAAEQRRYLSDLLGAVPVPRQWTVSATNHPWADFEPAEPTPAPADRPVWVNCGNTEPAPPAAEPDPQGDVVVTTDNNHILRKNALRITHGAYAGSWVPNPRDSAVDHLCEAGWVEVVGVADVRWDLGPLSPELVALKQANKDFVFHARHRSANSMLNDPTRYRRNYPLIHIDALYSYNGRSYPRRRMASQAWVPVEHCEYLPDSSRWCIKGTALDLPSGRRIHHQDIGHCYIYAYGRLGDLSCLHRASELRYASILQHDHNEDGYVLESDPDYTYCEERGAHVPVGMQVPANGMVRGYHGSPRPALHFSRPVSAVRFSSGRFTNQQGPSRLWKYGLGFEVEKNFLPSVTVNGVNYNVADERECIVHPEPLFAGWETDSSCGVEGITNVYGIDQYDLFAQHVDQSVYMDAPTDLSCGGHVNLSGPGLTLAKVRPYAGLIYALYRFRLNGNYTNRNKKLKNIVEQDHHDRYAAIRVKRNGLVEFRLVGRVRSAAQLKNRFLLFKELCRAMHYGHTFAEFLTNVDPVLRKMYPGSMDHRRQDVVNKALQFQRWLDEGVADPDIHEFLRGESLS